MIILMRGFLFFQIFSQALAGQRMKVPDKIEDSQTYVLNLPSIADELKVPNG